MTNTKKLYVQLLKKMAETIKIIEKIIQAEEKTSVHILDGETKNTYEDK